MAGTITIATGLTYTTIQVGTPATAMAELNKYLVILGQPTVEIGDANPLIDWLTDLVIGGGTFDRTVSMGDLATSTLLDRLDAVTFDKIALMVDMGGDVYGMRVFFEVNETDEVPEGFPNRTYTKGIDNPVTKVHTWKSYSDAGSSNTYPQLISGKRYVPNQNWQDRGTVLPASMWATDGLKILSLADYLALQPVAGPTTIPPHPHPHPHP